MSVLVAHPDPRGVPRMRPLYHLASNMASEGYDARQQGCREMGLEVRGWIHQVLMEVRTFSVDVPECNEVECIASTQGRRGVGEATSSSSGYRNLSS